MLVGSPDYISFIPESRDYLPRLFSQRKMRGRDWLRACAFSCSDFFDLSAGCYYNKAFVIIIVVMLVGSGGEEGEFVA